MFYLSVSLHLAIFGVAFCAKVPLLSPEQKAAVDRRRIAMEDRAFNHGIKVMDKQKDKEFFDGLESLVSDLKDVVRRVLDPNDPEAMAQAARDKLKSSRTGHEVIQDVKRVDDSVKAEWRSVNSDLIEGLEGMNDDLQPTRRKRALEEEDPSMACLEQCAWEMNNERRVSGLVKKAPFGNLFVPDIQLTEKNLDLWCDITEAFQDCVQNDCDMQLHYSNYQYLCQEHREEFLSHFECLNLAAPVVDQDCLSSCYSRTRGFLNLPKFDVDCKAFACDFNCIRPAVVGACGDEEAKASQFLMQLTKWLVNERKKSVLRHDGFLFPISCIEFMCDN